MLIIFSEETQILETMQLVDKLVFYYIAERMDLKTGVTGFSRKISYGGMSFDLSERVTERHSVDRLKVFTLPQIRASIRRLVTAGLFEAKSESGKDNTLVIKRVFYARFLGLGHCVQKPDDRPDDRPNFKNLEILSSLIKNIENKSTKVCRPDDRPDDRTSLYIYKQGNFEQNGLNDPFQEFSMAMDWAPIFDDLSIGLIRSGYSMNQVKDEWLREFVLFWYATPQVRFNQQKWTALLLRQVIKYLRDPGFFEQLTAKHAPDKDTKRGQVVKFKRGPDWANPPTGGADVLGPWMRTHGYGDGPPGLTIQQTRDWLRTQIEMRKKREGLL